MRTIKFRGKNPKGNWVIGDLLRNRGETFIAPDGIQNPLATADDFLVDQETVGQYTGVVDHKGYQIYEGDVMRHGFDDDTSPNMTVSFDDGIFFTRYLDSSYKHILNNHAATSLNLTIIGNIHDNPETLKMEGKGDE